MKESDNFEEQEAKTSFIDRKKAQWNEPGGKKRVLLQGAILTVFLLALPKIIPVISDVIPSSGTLVEETFQVDVVVVQTHPLEDNLFATGNIVANQEVNLSAEVSGVITQLNIEEGARVRRGQLLVKINDNDLQAQLRQAQYALEVMTETAERQRVLFERGGTSQEEYDQSRIQLNSLKADVELLEAQIQRTEVRAPFDGVLGLKYVNVGGYITPNSRIASLQDISSIKIDFGVPERYAAQIGPGTTIRFNVQGIDSTFAGSVYAVEPQIDTRTRTLQVRAEASNDEGYLRPGSFANIDVILDDLDEAILIPSISLIPDLGAYKVISYSDGRAQSRPVTIGMRTPDAVQITSGLVPGDTVLTSGLLQVRDGMPVTVGSIRDGL
ncbi:MAG: efflux RND transporter periplasmic adaptor subunit [Balneolales bacterium]|nr:efflux RND transporter periplasmic adaptor subunit [Balneolales bacterium]